MRCDHIPKHGPAWDLCTACIQLAHDRASAEFRSLPLDEKRKRIEEATNGTAFRELWDRRSGWKAHGMEDLLENAERQVAEEKRARGIEEELGDVEIGGVPATLAVSMFAMFTGDVRLAARLMTPHVNKVVEKHLCEREGRPSVDSSFFDVLKKPASGSLAEKYGSKDPSSES